jgi:hypothetical protein
LGDADDLATKIEYVFAHPEETQRMVERGQEVYRAHQWSSERSRFLSLAKDLIGGTVGVPASADGPTSVELGSTK